MFMKKWWLTFKTEDLEWSGWINTIHSSKETIPEKITGTFYTMKDEEGCHGEFKLDNPEWTEDKEGFYVITAFCNKIWKGPTGEALTCDRKNIRAFLENRSNLKTWERFDRKIEDCLDLEKTYVDTY